MHIRIEKREAARLKAVRLWMGAGAVLVAHYALGELGVSFVQRLVLLFTVVVLGIAGIEAFIERHEG
ncbi:MAG TPA: hypothetical protein VHC69_22550 [Polyangiaceae bacterium]|nr:hypothetical protein [Polyangiaceae bacterium]